MILQLLRIAIGVIKIGENQQKRNTIDWDIEIKKSQRDLENDGIFEYSSKSDNE